jgi:hypothetical protein
MPLGIISKNLFINGKLTNSDEIRKNILLRNLPVPDNNPDYDTTIELGNYTSIYEHSLGRIVSYPIGEEKLSNPIEFSIQVDGIVQRDTMVAYNQYIPLNQLYETVSVTKDVKLKTTDRKPYDKTNFSLAGGNDFSKDLSIVYFSDRLTLDKESPLGIIGYEKLKDNINANKENIHDKTVGNINSSSISSGLNNSLNYNDFTITTTINETDKVSLYMNSIRGLRFPSSIIPKDAIGWNEFNYGKKDSKSTSPLGKLLNQLGVNNPVNSGTESRMDTLLEVTSSGQKNILFSLLKLNTYAPQYSANRTFNVFTEIGSEYSYYVGTKNNTNISNGINYRLNETDFGIGTINTLNDTKDNPFVWNTNYPTINPFNNKTLLYKTQQILNNSSRYVFINQNKTQFIDPSTFKQISKGSAIKNTNGEYFRVWKKSSDSKDQLTDGYSYRNAIRNSGLFDNINTEQNFRTRKISTDSVLQSNGLPRIHPSFKDKAEKGAANITSYKNYMLSLENLAWSDNISELPLWERGPGDLLTKKQGRLMWFAPYDLKFDESVSPSWEGIKFLGRSEPLYTYNGVERSGQLSFKMVVDHPSIINSYRGKKDKILEEFFSGNWSTDPETGKQANINEFFELLKKSSKTNEISKTLKNKINVDQLKLKTLNDQKKLAQVALDKTSAIGNTKELNSEKSKEIKEIEKEINEITQKANNNIDTFYSTNNATTNRAADLFEKLNEANYFDIVDKEFPTYFDNISEKIKYFHPGFHSTTPEGLNSRLTFLHQCTRQGKSIGDENIQNMAFGKPPVCILRIGDFFHTKIIIDSMTINYEGGGGIQWDLNPEGVGVQPMIANISLGIKLIGGQSIKGPINRLQNALSFNFYSNTEFYDLRSDYISTQNDVKIMNDWDDITKNEREFIISILDQLSTQSSDNGDLSDGVTINIVNLNEAIYFSSLENGIETKPNGIENAKNNNKLKIKLSIDGDVIYTEKEKDDFGIVVDLENDINILNRGKINKIKESANKINLLNIELSNKNNQFDICSTNPSCTPNNLLKLQKEIENIEKDIETEQKNGKAELIAEGTFTKSFTDVIKKKVFILDGTSGTFKVTVK